MFEEEEIKKKINNNKKKKSGVELMKRELNREYCNCKLKTKKLTKLIEPCN